MKTVTVELYSDGSSKVESSGFTGNSCSLATKEIELALAGSDSSNRDDRKKPEFFAQNPVDNTLGS